MRIGFLGAGTMGAPMIGHLVAAGHSVRVYNRTAGRALALEGGRCEAVETPAAAADSADAILSCVSDDEASRQVWGDHDGAFSAAASGALALELSTLSLERIDEWARTAIGAGLRPVDSPVTGSRAGAEAGTLTAFLGGADADVGAALAVLHTFCADHFAFGPAGSGMRFKLVYNTVGATIGATLAEGLTVLDRLGLPVDACVEAFKRTGWAAPAARSKADAMRSGSYSPASFKSSLMHKDLRYLRRATADVDVPLPLARLVCDIYAAVVESGGGDLDFSAVKARFYESESSS